jgi:VIT1/CCC1 family predicted Fe2+/Mn2+ transporter
VLDPSERACEVLFGLIVVLTFTLTISVEGGATDTRTVLMAAIGCNLAWGIVDAVMYLIATFTQRARTVAAVRSLRRSADRASAHRLLQEQLGPFFSSVLTPEQLDAMRENLTQAPAPAFETLNRADLLGAAGVCLLVFFSTFPIVVPFMVMRDLPVALRTSNGIAIGMMFVTGWSLGRYTGRPGWHTGLAMVGVGLLLVGITLALGG